jgi:hypothetical protein
VPLLCVHNVDRAAVLARRQHVNGRLCINLVLAHKVQPGGDTVKRHGCNVAQPGRQRDGARAGRRSGQIRAEDGHDGTGRDALRGVAGGIQDASSVNRWHGWTEPQGETEHRGTAWRAYKGAGATVPASQRCPVEISVSGLEQRRLGACAVRASALGAEAVERRQHSARSDFEDCATPLSQLAPPYAVAP